MCPVAMKMRTMSTVVVLLLSVGVLGTHAKNQTYTVHGKFVCGQKPLADAQVELYAEELGDYE